MVRTGTGTLAIKDIKIGNNVIVAASAGVIRDVVDGALSGWSSSEINKG